MPNTNRQQTVYIQNGDPDAMNESSLYAAGHLGAAFDWNDRQYQIVQLDSGATSATSVGAVTANDLAFWKDQDNFIVTNDQAQAIGSGVSNAWRNFVAGVFPYAATAGYYTAIIQKGDNVPVNATAGGGIGQTVIANSGSDADVNFVAVGTASTYQPLGIAREATGDTTTGMVNVDLDIVPIP